MYKLDLPVDMRESAAIERRKQRELERQSRIFNASVRTIGVDLHALEQQVQERHNREEQERRREAAYAADMTRNDKIVMLMEKRRENDLRALDECVNKFRQEHQQPESRREFDIYDPEGKKKDKPARVSDDDPRCGISSMQKFLGEDLNDVERKKLQQAQLRAWSEQQASERALESAKCARVDHLHDLKSLELDQRAMQLERDEMDCRRNLNLATKEYNLALARERCANEDDAKRQAQEDNFTEISNQVFSDMLTENPSVATSAFGSHRVITDRWKGMSPAEVNDIRNTQHEQIEESKRIREEEEHNDKQWEDNRLAQAHTAIIMERQQERLRTELNKQQAEENLRLATSQKQRKEYMDKELYTNDPTSKFFTQFNTSSR